MFFFFVLKDTLKMQSNGVVEREQLKKAFHQIVQQLVPQGRSDDFQQVITAVGIFKRFFWSK